MCPSNLFSSFVIYRWEKYFCRRLFNKNLHFLWSTVDGCLKFFFICYENSKTMQIFSIPKSVPEDSCEGITQNFTALLMSFCCPQRIFIFYFNPKYFSNKLEKTQTSKTTKPKDSAINPTITILICELDIIHSH